MIVDHHVPPEGRFQVASTATFFTRLNWTNYRIWMYTDDQRFDTDGTFGPVAHIAPADSLDAFSHDRFSAAADTGLNVGAIWIDVPSMPASLPENYRALKITAVRNCVRISKVGNNWFGYVFPEREIGNPCPMPAQVPPPLKVRRVVAFPDTASIPPVARWHEGKRGGKDRMHFGLKCADRWCMVMPEGADTVPLPHKGKRPTERGWETHGWHDVQRLAVLNDAGRPIPGRIKASIMPVPKLGDFKITADFDTGWVHVATVEIHGPLNGRHAKYGRPPSTTDRGYWGFFQGGDNDIYLRTTTDSATYPSGWMAEVRHPKNGAFALVVVERHEHTPKTIPGTVRFRWIDHDDGDWIRCDNGCCKIGVM